MGKKLDVLFVNPDSSFQSYGELSKKGLTAIEPPTWALLLAESCRVRGFSVAILDCGAEQLSLSDAVNCIADVSPRLVCFVMYGQNPNSGTASMAGAELLGTQLKLEYPRLVTCFVGSHVSALPKEVLALPCVDIVLLNEGVYALRNLLASDLSLQSLSKIKGIGYKLDGVNIFNSPEQVVPQDRMDVDLPGYAWDLLPYRSKPFDLYRSHLSYAGYNDANRTPYAAIYTSLGCPFKCDFCMINILNRTNNQDGVSAADSAQIRLWSTDWVMKQIVRLRNMGVRTIRISDEMFFLREYHYLPLLSQIVERDLGLRMWAYTRVDTTREKHLDLFRRAGIDWLCIGIEAANQMVRREVTKGMFSDVNIREVVNTISQHGISLNANYIIGLPEDSFVTMQETLNLAIELMTPEATFSPCTALPGSPLYVAAKATGMALPDSYSAGGFYAYDCQPIATRHCTAKEVLHFRDYAWKVYHEHPVFLALVERRFGPVERQKIEEMARVKMRRKILGDPPPEG